MTDERQPLDPDPPPTEDLPATEPATDSVTLEGSGPPDEAAPVDEPSLPDESASTAEPAADEETTDELAPTDEPAPTRESAPIDTAGGHRGTHAATHGARRVGGTRADRNIVAFGLGMMLCAILIALVPDFAPAPGIGSPDRLHGRILTVVPGALAAPSATVTVLDGDRRGDVLSAMLEGPTGTFDVPGYAPGDEVLVASDAQPDGSFTYTVVDRWRLPVVGWLLGGFAFALIAVAGWAGLRALTALAITLCVVVRLLIPLLLAGYDPVALAVGLGIAITGITLLLTHGFSRVTGVAIAGTAMGLFVTAALAALVSGIAAFGAAQGSEQIAVLGRSLGDSVDLSGLLLAAIILGGLGVLNDVTVTQAVAVEEFIRHDPALKERELFRRTMAAGLSHLAASINTLVLAYVGASLPVIAILALQVHRLDLTLNDEHVAAEIVRTFVGALGVLAAVPLTTAIAAIWVRRSESARWHRARRVMATRPAGPANRFGSLGWLGRLRPRKPDATGRPGFWTSEPIDGPVEPLGRRRSPRPRSTTRAKIVTVQTELPLLAAAEPPVAAAESPVEIPAADEPRDDGAVAPEDAASPAPLGDPPVRQDDPPVPPTKPVVTRRPRRRGPAA